jgi:hypothetical protein
VDIIFGDNSVDQGGGNGLVLFVRDYTTIFADLNPYSPKLLKAETVSMFTPQIPADSNGVSMLREAHPV